MERGGGKGDEMSISFTFLFFFQPNLVRLNFLVICSLSDDDDDGIVPPVNDGCDGGRDDSAGL